MKKEATYVRKSCLMLLALCLWLLPATVGAAPGDKKVSVDFKSVPVITVLNAIQKQAGLNFVYSSQLAATWPKVSITAKQEPAVQVIERLTDMINCSYKINGDVVSISQQKSGKERTVKGVVRDSDGEPLVGVPVSTGDGNVIAVTDVNGSYTVTIPVEETVLRYSYVGMETAHVTIPRGNKEVKRDIMLRSNSQLKEVIITGYQDISKPKMTGSASVINAKKLEERYTANILDNIEGRVAGVSTYGGKLTVRGTSSLYAETSPLLVLDGVPIEGKIEDINPYEIENITILKDAAATAIYGARATNGIVVITTKNANKQNKIEIDFTTNLSISEKKNYKYEDNWYLAAADQLKIESDYWKYYYFDNNGEVADPIGATQRSITGGSLVSPLRYLFYQLAQGQISESQLNSNIENLAKNNFTKEYTNKILRSQVLQQYNLSLRSRSDKSTQNFTFNYKHDNLGYIESSNHVFNINYKGFFDIAKWLTATFRIKGIYDKNSRTGDSTATNPFSVPAYYRLFNDDGSSAWTNTGLGLEYDTSTESDPALLTMKYNHYDEFFNSRHFTTRSYMSYHCDFLFKIIDGLSANAQFLFETDNTNDEYYNAAESYTSRLIRNSYTVKNADGTFSYMTGKNGGLKRSSNLRGNYWTARGQLNYGKAFDKHDLAVIAGMEFRQTLTCGENTILMGYDDQLQNSQTASVNFGTIKDITLAPYFYKLSGTYNPQSLAYNPYIKPYLEPIIEEKHRYSSVYANLSYTYNDRYNAFASIRKDYADLYGLNAKYRGAPLWSAGIAWNVDQELFTQNAIWINFLKLRISYGMTGNIYQGATSYLTASSTEVNSLTNSPMSVISSPANPNLKWEQTKTTNIGIDYSLFNNRLRGAFEYYLKRGQNIFSPLTLNPSTGFASMVANLADMRNDGIELTLIYDCFRSKGEYDFSWTTAFTGSFNKNKITYVENTSNYAWELFSNNSFKQGYPTSALFAYDFAGIEDINGNKHGEVVYYRADGETTDNGMYMTADEVVFTGQSEPKYVLGLDNSFRYGPFTLSVLMAYYGGHHIRALSIDENFGFESQGLKPLREWYRDAWTPENGSDIPGIGRYCSNNIGQETTYSTTSIHFGDFLKIRNVVLGYELPRLLLSKWGINRVALRIQLDNPKYLWTRNKMHIDPETLGVRTPSTVVFGLNINL